MNQPSIHPKLTPPSPLSVGKLSLQLIDQPQPPHYQYQLTPTPSGPAREVRRASLAFCGCTLLSMFLFWFAPQILGEICVFLLDLFEIQETSFVWDLLNQLLMLPLYLIGFLPPFLLFANRSGYSINRIPHRRPAVQVLFLSLGLAMGASIVGGWLSAVAVAVCDFVGLPPVFLGELPTHPLTIALYVVNSTVVPAVLEEMVFRGLVMQSLRRFGDGAALLISSLFFGLMHENVAQFPHAFLIGLAIGYCVLQTDSIYTGIFIHFVHNMIITLGMLLQESLVYDWQMILVDAAHMLLYFAGFVLAVVCLLRRRASWRLASSPHAYPFGGTMRQFFATPAMVVLLLAYVAAFWNNFG